MDFDVGGYFKDSKVLPEDLAKALFELFNAEEKNLKPFLEVYNCDFPGNGIKEILIDIKISLIKTVRITLWGRCNDCNETPTIYTAHYAEYV